MMKHNFYIIINLLSLNIPEKMLANAAIMKLKITPGPAIFRATIPATRYMPVPQHEPTPNDVRSSVVRHFCWKNHFTILSTLGFYIWYGDSGRVCVFVANTVSLGLLLLCSLSDCIFRRSLVRTSFENNATPDPPPGIGKENFMVLTGGWNYAGIPIQSFWGGAGKSADKEQF